MDMLTVFTQRTIAMSKELKPCPFDGYAASYYKESNTGYSDCHIVMCEYCEVSKRGESKEDAIADWNTRHISCNKGESDE